VAYIGWAMAQPDGDRLVPRVNGRPFLQEPPLVHWLGALSLRLSGGPAAGDWAPRVPSMLFSMATLLLLGLEARRLLGPRGALLAVLLLASTAEYLEVANRAGTDAALTFFVALGGFGLLALAREPSPGFALAALVGGAAGFSFLAKNLLGPAYLGLILAAVLLRRRDLLRSRAFWLRAGLGLLVFAAVALPWPLALARRDPALLEVLLVENTLGRFVSQGKHDPPFLEFSLRVLADWLPWTPLFLAGLARLLARGVERGSGEREQAWTVLAWVLLPALLVLFSGSKRNLYLLPLYPALALAGASFLEEVRESGAARRLSVGAIVLLAPVLPAAALLGGR
jgi:4-amino-4-deoxy-L-arabinose transferase-like glycosyltransferase